MRKFINLLKLFFLQSRLKLSRSMEYRTDFFLGVLVSLCFSSLAPLVQLLIFLKTRGYPGWQFYEVILLQGMLLFWFGLKDTFFGEVRPLINNLIWKGEFDRLLLKPFPAIGIILASGFNYYGFGSLIAGIGISTFALVKLNIGISMGSSLIFFLFMVFGMVMYMAVSVIYCTIIVLVVWPGRVGEIFDKLLRFAEFPLEIYSGIIRLALMTVIPLSVFVYFPTQALLGRLPLMAYLSIPISLLFFLLSIFIWNNQLKNYRSAGG